MIIKLVSQVSFFLLTRNVDVILRNFMYFLHYDIVLIFWKLYIDFAYIFPVIVHLIHNTSYIWLLWNVASLANPFRLLPFIIVDIDTHTKLYLQYTFSFWWKVFVEAVNSKWPSFECNQDHENSVLRLL